MLEVVSRRWDDLDTALAEAVVAIAMGPLKRELLLYREECTRRGIPFSGRAALWHVYQGFKLDKGQAMYVDMSALVQVKYQGDLAGFLDAWDFILMALPKLPDEELLVALLETELRKCKALGPAFVVFDGAEAGSIQRTSKFLYEAGRKEVARSQREATKQGLLKTNLKASPGYVAPKPPKPKPPKNKAPDAVPPKDSPVAKQPENDPSKQDDEVCRSYAKTGRCGFGNKCRF